MKILSISKTNFCQNPNKFQSQPVQTNYAVQEPHLDKIKFHMGMAQLTDKEIAIINKNKKLPDNARFIYRFTRGDGHSRPVYDIMECPMPSLTGKEVRGIQNLPEGYIVVRSDFGIPRAVDIRNTVVSKKKQ
jgi:hypothetical protein